MLPVQSTIKKLCALVLVTAVIMSGGFVSAASAGGISAAPLNPKFVQWQKNTDEAKTSSPQKGTTNSRGRAASYGYVPSPINWSGLVGNKVYSVVKAADNRGAIPATYDLRSEMPAVRNQGDYGTCWTFSAMAAAESNLIHEKGILTKDNADLSEWYLAYYGHNDESDDLPSFTYGTEKHYDSGGNDWMSAAILSRGTGFLEESSAEYPNPQDEAHDYKPEVQSRKYKLKNALYLGDLGVKEVRLKGDRINMIKEAIMEYGAVSIGIYQSDFIADSGAYFEDATDWYANHAVTIVGWDDNYAVSNFTSPANTPSGPGAWIVRNSWGDDYGDEGYYYVSYEEGSLNDGVVYDTDSAPDNEKIYQYDPLGLCDFFAYTIGLNDAYFANIFTASRNENINSVAFYTSIPESQCNIKIYKDCGDDPIGGTLIAEKNVTVTAPGYNTVDLDSAVEIPENVKFSVVVSISGLETTDYAMPVEYPFSDTWSEKATASAGQSFISMDGIEWEDLTGQVANANICIKAFGTIDDPDPDPGTGGSGGCSTGPVMLILLGLGVLPFVYRGRKQ